ncbi:MAG: AAA family ATPase, partial [Sedimentisphaerales bacterium]|nr:AAA family ATPase [Sedimentisphaerales bacterium]
RLHRKKPIEVGITQKGLDTIVRNLRGLTRRQAMRIISDAVAADQRFSDEDINIVIANKRRMIQQGGLLEYIQTPLDLSEIGGMNRLKRWLNQRRDAFSHEAKEFGLTPPRGVLMLGVQGAGKSLCAKAIATAWHQPLLRLDPGTLYGSFIGESEHNLRDALRQTEMMSPVILWIDEIEKAFASAASRSADGGLSQRMFGTLLTWLQEREAPVFVVATANDIEALPPELLRKGRFDEIFFVDLPTAEVREQIFAIHLSKRGRDPKKFDLAALAEASEGRSGSEIEQAVISALHEAYAEKAELDTQRIVAAVQASPPLSATMAEKVSILRQWGQGRCMSAD